MLPQSWEEGGLNQCCIKSNFFFDFQMETDFRGDSGVDTAVKTLHSNISAVLSIMIRLEYIK